ncbi:hypothetical protein PoB_003145000 [Plakobranchus ocellatus]|uniref:Uncharacterized protein n=1 Tax=Plakobranchus ocellatus TaxID=259542 RepID=A0AAV4A9T9_9GAST|nr:hypothetical protein PoB_003145000 [Plakobranchus ocellatus]
MYADSGRQNIVLTVVLTKVDQQVKRTCGMTEGQRQIAVTCMLTEESEKTLVSLLYTNGFLPAIKDSLHPVLCVFLIQRETDPSKLYCSRRLISSCEIYINRRINLTSVEKYILINLHFVLFPGTSMSLLPMLLLLGVAIVGTVQGYATYKASGVFLGRKYYVSDQWESFNLAKMNERCKKDLGGYLVQIDQWREQAVVTDFIFSFFGELNRYVRLLVQWRNEIFLQQWDPSRMYVPLKEHGIVSSDLDLRMTRVGSNGNRNDAAATKD